MNLTHPKLDTLTRWGVDEPTKRSDNQYLYWIIGNYPMGSGTTCCKNYGDQLLYTDDALITDYRVGAGGSSTSPILSVSPSSMSFSAIQGGANPPSQNLNISNAGGGTLSWSITDNASWLSVSPALGTNNASATVSAPSTGLANGIYSATVTVTASGASASPQSIPVTLTVTSQASSGSPIAHWKLDETGGTTASDSAGTNPGSLSNMESSDWVPGKFGNALSFDGVDESVDMGDPADGSLDFDASQSFTLSSWVNAQGPAEAYGLSKFSGSLGAGYAMRIQNGAASCRLADGTNRVETAMVSYGSGWRHLACVVDRGAGVMRLYVDGIAQPTYGIGAIGSAANAVPFYLAKKQALYMPGMLDEVRIYNRALSPSEVQALFAGAVSTRGDLDSSGTVDLTDVRLLIEMIVGQTSPDLGVADLDSDGQLTLGDVRELINILISP